MRPPTLGGLIEVGLDILSAVASAATKRILIQTGDVVKESTEADQTEWWQHVGFVSLPPKPQAKKKAAQAVVVKAADRDVAVASCDDRGLELQGNLTYGETCLYAAGEDGEAQARVLLKKDGSINLYTRKGNSPTGAGMIVQMDAQNGAIRLVNDKGYGIIIDEDGVKITSGGAGLTLDSGGDISLVGTGQTSVDGNIVILGSNVVPVAPGVSSALTGVTGLVGVASAKVLISTA